MIRYIFTIAVFTACLSAQANAKTYEIAIRQIHLHAPVSHAVCDEQNAPCHMSVVFMPQTVARSEKDTYLDVVITFEEGVPHVHFKHKTQSVFTRNGQYNTQGYQMPDGEYIAEITLLKPHDLEAAGLKKDLILRPAQTLGDFEITIIPK